MKKEEEQVEEEVKNTLENAYNKKIKLVLREFGGGKKNGNLECERVSKSKWRRGGGEVDGWWDQENMIFFPILSLCSRAGVCWMEWEMVFGVENIILPFLGWQI